MTSKSARTEIELQTTNLLNSKFSSLVRVDAGRDAIEELREEVEKSKAASELRQLEFIEAKESKAVQIREIISCIYNSLNVAQEQSLSSHAAADELGSLTTELVSSYSQDRRPAILEDLEIFHRNLKELVSVRDYLSVITHVLRLSESSISQVKTWLSSASASDIPVLDKSYLANYGVLQSFVSSMSQKVSAESIGAPEPLSLVSFLFKIRDQTWTSIKGILSSQLLQLLESIGWPNAIDLDIVSKQTQFGVTFTNLLLLQAVGEDLHKDDVRWKSSGIYPIQTLVVPISLRFKFHFEGSRDTNRIDKPEWFFTHIANEVHKHRPFLETHVARLLSSTKYKQINAYREFTLSLLPLLSRKIRQTIPSILGHPALLAHTIYACLAFDATIQETGFSFDGTSANMGKASRDPRECVWEGLTTEIIGNKEWFQSWLEGERQFANNQYIEIISEPKAWQIADGDHAFTNDARDDFKPTNSSRRLTALVEQITERYRSLPGFYFRTQFLIHVQLPILEMYHSRISASVDAFESLSTSFVRAVPGALSHQIGHATDTRNPTSGVDGLDKLVRAAISASYIATRLDKWNEDQFFLEMWTEINTRVSFRDKSSIPSGRTSSLDESVFAAAQGSIFQELVDQYRKLIHRAESMIVNHVCSEVELAGKVYFSSHHASPEESSNSLALPLLSLSTHLKLLVSSLPTKTFIPLYRQIVSRLSDLFYERRIFVLGSQLSFREVNQIAEECLLWVQSCKMVLEPVVKHSDGPWKRLLDIMKILTLPEDNFQALALQVGKIKPGDIELIQDDFDTSNLDLNDMKNIVKIRQNLRQ